MSTAMLAGLAAGVAVCTTAHAAAEAPEQGLAEAPEGKLRICASEKDAPFSMEDGAGFDNQIAQVLAEGMGRDAEFVWTEKAAIYLVRDFLNTDACDLVTGIDAGDPRVLTSEPYYRSGYVFVTRQDTDFDANTWRDERLGGFSRFAMSFGSPAEVMLRQLGHGKFEDNAAYLYGLTGFKSRRNQYLRLEPSVMVSEVASGNADIAVAFAPEVARYVKDSSTPLRMTVIADNQTRRDGLPVPQHFDQTFGVRTSDKVLLDEVNAALEKVRPKIDAILSEEGIPTVDGSS
ncbi:methanol oxidation system protein MoxJ [Marinivivus vitaminiproducens]|nr:methanol oxidation system protein MoxJ [Geminicoccaceae bacterium SCSIO 64248]